MALVIRPLQESDIAIISSAFAEIGWNKPASQYERYLQDQALGHRSVLVAERNGRFAGYLAICRAAFYPPFRETEIPEIVDLNVLPPFRRQGIATALLDEAEAQIAAWSPIAGIGVGLTPDYGAAQRLYVKRGYIPDGLGITTTGGRRVAPQEMVRADDDLVLHLTKRLWE